MSLHTDHRPQQFADVIGQKQAVKSLQAAAKEGRAHTYLLTGPPGTGKTTLARILADAFTGGKATAANIEEFDAATNSGADAVRAVVVRTMHKAIGESSVKTIIMDEAHRLSAAAWTVLLKPIEEPPKHVYWVFCSTEPGRIPKAIQTRCFRCDLKPVPEEDILELLVKVADAEKLDTSDEILEAIAENCEGSPRQALIYLEACRFAESASDALQTMRSAGQTKEIIDFCRFLVAERGQTWTAAIKLIKDIGDVEAESVRIVTCNYLASCLLGTTNEKKAVKLLGILECFKGPYNQSDKMAPLLLSTGMAIDLGT